MNLDQSSAGHDVPPPISPKPKRQDQNSSRNDTVDSGVDSKESEEPTRYTSSRNDMVDSGLDSEKSEEPTRYDIGKSSKKGIFVIFNHEEFTVNSLPKRDGTNEDEKRLQVVFENLGFRVDVHKDLRLYEIQQEIRKYASTDYHKEYAMFGCAVLTHGAEGDLIYAKDESYKVNDLYEPFQECKSLVGKPKFFFMQACRGEKLDDGNKRRDTVDAKGSLESDSTAIKVDKPQIIKIPKEADFLIAYSTPPGYYAWRDSLKGSWFIQTLCDRVERHANHWDLLTILTQVNRDVSQRESSTNVTDSHGKKQCPSVVTRLTALLYLSPVRSGSATSSSPMPATTATGDVESPEEKQDYYQLKMELMRKKMEVLKLKESICQKKLKVDFTL